MKYIIVPSLLLSVLAAALSARAGNLGVPELFVKGIYNHARHETTGSRLGFKSDTKGIIVGAGLKLSNAMTVGIGYGYTDTTVDLSLQDLDIKGHQFFLQGEYHPNAWYANWLMSYGYGRYEGKDVQAKYHVNTYALDIMSGYLFNVGFAPEWGLRYLVADQPAYVADEKKVQSDRSEFLTGVVGGRYSTAFSSTQMKWLPFIHAGVTYDFISDGAKTNIEISRGNYYQINGRRLHRFGVEAGAGLTIAVNGWDFSVAYEGDYRKNFQSHTGLLRGQYRF